MAGQDQPILEVYQTGPTTIVGFGGRDVLADVNVAACREELVELVKVQKCDVVAFDLTGVKLLPSGLLGLLASLRNINVEVHVYNPSDDVREALSITGLDQLMPIHEIAVSRKEA